MCRDGWVADWPEKADALNTLLDRGAHGQCSSRTRSKIGTLISCRKFCIHCPKTRMESSLTWRSANDTATASNESLCWSEPSQMSREQGHDQGAYEKPNEKRQCQHPNRCGGVAVFDSAARDEFAFGAALLLTNSRRLGNSFDGKRSWNATCFKHLGQSTVDCCSDESDSNDQ